MSEIIKTEAVVLSKMNYGDTSSISHLFTKDHGKLTTILKGARNPRSKIGNIVDPLNLLQVVIYKKPSREIQLLSSVDLVEHYPGIKSDFEKIKYAYAVLELVKKLTPDEEPNLRLYRGVVRILSLINESNRKPLISFNKFFLFFLTELGYELQLKECAVCSKTNLDNMNLSYNFEIGILCDGCRKDYIESFNIERELFRHLICLKNNKNEIEYRDDILKRALVFMERYLKFHVPDFKGIQSFQLYN